MAAPEKSLPPSVEIASYFGGRAKIRHLFELAEDSSAALDGYLSDGVVLVASRQETILGHIQLVPFGDPGSVAWEIKNMAVERLWQGNGIGSGLVSAGIDTAVAAGATGMVVATAAADIGNLRFYQRRGFRLLSVERDAFTPATGYPDPIVIDGIELRDRVWLDRRI